MVNKQRNSLKANQVRHLNGAKFGSALDQFPAKTAMAGVCSRFAFATTTTIEELRNCSKNKNTAKSTDFWLSVWKKWCLEKKITDEIENYEPAELNTLLKHFYAEVKNKQVTENLVSPNRCWKAKQNSFAWLAVVSAQTKLDKYQRRKKKFSGRAENSEVITQNI